METTVDTKEETTKGTKSNKAIDRSTESRASEQRTYLETDTWLTIPPEVEEKYNKSIGTPEEEDWREKKKAVFNTIEEM